MANLTPASSFDDVPRLETTTLVLGGPGGPANLPLQALLNRTQWLHDNASAGSAGPYAGGTGTANACAATFTPPIAATVDGLKLRFTAAAANTGAATFAPDAIAPASILGQAGLALQGGEIAANGEVEVTWSDAYSAWVMTACSGGALQVADATASHHAASKGQMDAVSSVANAAAPSADLASAAAGKGGVLVGFQQTGASTVPTTVDDELRERLSASQWGVVGDGVADDYAKIQAALNEAPLGAIIELPLGAFRTSQTIVVPADKDLVGKGLGGTGGSMPVQIIGDLAVTPVVKLDGGAGSHAVTLRGVGIFRAPGIVPAGAVGLEVDNADQASVLDCFLARHAIGIKVSGQLGILFERVTTSVISESHVQINGAVETTFQNCRFGRNGGGDVACTNYVELVGTGVDTVTFMRCQFNQSGGAVTNVIKLTGYTNTNGILVLIGCHAERFSNFLVGDGSSSIRRVMLDANTIISGTTNPLASNLDNSLIEFVATGNVCNLSLNLVGASPFNVCNNRFGGSITINGGKGVCVGNTANTGLTVTGALAGAVIANNSVDSGSAITNTATGNYTFIGNTSTSATNDNGKTAVIPQGYLGLGGGTPFAVKQFTGTSDASGNVSFAHGISSGQLRTLVAMCFYRGTSGEAKAATLNFIDGANAKWTGAGVSVAYRASIIYCDGASAVSW